MASVINSVPALRGVTFRITYDISEQPNRGIAGEVSSRYGIATQVDPLDSGVYRYTFDEPFLEGAHAYVDIEPGNLFEPTYFQLNQLGELPAPPPPSTQLVSGIFDFRYLGIEPSVSALDYGLTIFGDPAATSPYFFDGTDWTLLPNFHLDDQTQTLIATTNRVGVIAAFQVVPEPSTITLCVVGVVCLCLYRRRRRQVA